MASNSGIYDCYPFISWLTVVIYMVVIPPLPHQSPCIFQQVIFRHNQGPWRLHQGPLWLQWWPSWLNAGDPWGNRRCIDCSGSQSGTTRGCTNCTRNIQNIPGALQTAPRVIQAATGAIQTATGMILTHLQNLKKFVFTNLSKIWPKNRSRSPIFELDLGHHKVQLHTKNERNPCVTSNFRVRKRKCQPLMTFDPLCWP